MRTTGTGPLHACVVCGAIVCLSVGDIILVAVCM